MTDVAKEASTQRRRPLTLLLLACALVVCAVTLTLEVEEQRARDQRSLITAEQDRLQRIETVLTASDAVSKRTTTKTGIRLSTVFSPDNHAAVVTYTDLPEIEPKQAYELWRIRNDVMKSMKILAPDGRDGTALVLDLNKGDAVAFTVEPEGGNGQPTGEIVVGLPIS
ncbi:anti-sigma factor [Cryptosporangium phraense]|uniref:Anti-sigma factor n=1 Tax=Cryptosporangium phraense TaxID=2593070 RepID=A0A545AF98_9ACTN|nr:anti-sigma factor [Cryptosporangium phraense]TQS39989.1 anti-sigma factor [Cryptosporangium phraense]